MWKPQCWGSYHLRFGGVDPHASYIATPGLSVRICKGFIPALEGWEDSKQVAVSKVLRTMPGAYQVGPKVMAVGPGCSWRGGGV